MVNGLPVQWVAHDYRRYAVFSVNGFYAKITWERKKCKETITSEAYCDFEAAVQEAMDDLNPEILDAVMDVTENTPDGDEITEKYWDTQRTLLKEFLEQLYDKVISTWR